eukprot:CAMPEP_0172408368 /NCGR_PEP_ID=MMETSP1061-20121228/75815_1 /TAXON_ID=37318 /ORGANISM="Pseudo-nitzschia pungens, Strain cf. pungens" /LENGTH=313 /DNA_ID=CAMNT_0013144493 /DNA_START=275 /DNA_END=1216 /DNA_ORIENTATION=-
MQYRPITLAIFFAWIVSIVSIVSIFPTVRARKDEESVGVGIHVLQKAMRFVKDTNYGDGDGNTPDVLERLESGHVHTLYKVAQAMNERENREDRLTSIEIWHALADHNDDNSNSNSNNGHILSQVALGFAYSEHDKASAVTYFVQAGEAGPHQAALFNAGRLLADPELEDFVKALAYLRAAYNLAETHPEYSTDHLTETSKLAYETLSAQLTGLVNESLGSKGGIALSIQEVADMFLYANLNDYPLAKSREEKIWARGMQSLQARNWEIAFVEFEKLQRTSREELSNLQLSLLNVLKQYCKSVSGIDLGSDEL